MRIFIIGPGGVGKSTSGKILANMLEYDFLDLDRIFLDKIGDIGNYIQNFGYEKYCLENSKLFYEVINNNYSDFIFALSSGFLVHKDLEQLTEKHKETLNNQGLTIRLLPSQSIGESTEIIVKRQLSRGFGLVEGKEKQKFIERYALYEKLGDIKIFSYESPEIIAEKMESEIRKFFESTKE